MVADYPPLPKGSPLGKAMAELMARGQGPKGKVTRVGHPTKKMPFGVFLEEVPVGEVRCKVCKQPLVEDNETSQRDQVHRVCAEAEQH